MHASKIEQNRTFLRQNLCCVRYLPDSAPDEIVFSIGEGSRDNKKLAELNWFIIFIIFYNDGLFYNVIAMMLTL